jgi:lipopolysaccharide/colanic/teichoic acid biosynthesis glycosyltransferase
LASISIAREVPRREFKWQAAEACERVISIGLLGALSPLVAGSALAVRLMSGRTPFIAHRRVGWRGEVLWMLKLRTMWGGGESATGVRRGLVEYIDDAAGPERKAPVDPRVAGRFARFCRRHSIDEIPQLWHVARGEMSLVGPRPVTAGELRRYYGADAAEVLQQKPGIAGLWQVSGRNRLTYPQRRKLDLDLVRNRSFRMYVKILLRTVPEILSGRNTC